jgi:glutathione synthase
MRIAFFVNSIRDEAAHYTTTLLAREALARGHDICYLTLGDFVLRADDTLLVRALMLPGSGYKKVETLHKALQGDQTRIETIDVREIDILMLRNDPSLDIGARPWAAHAGTMFGRLASARGVLVLNDPDGLSLAQNKLYFQSFPDIVRPATLISKSIDEIRAFVDDQPEGVVVKPLQGSGGRNVFKDDSTKDANLNQIVEAVAEEGYLIAQCYIPAATAGDVRLFMMNGVPLERGGKIAALRRVPADGEVRSNMHVQGKPEKAAVNDAILATADLVRPKLIHDGLFLVGLDIVGDKILEVNVFTPGGLYSICELQRTNFAETVIVALERKLEIRAAFGNAIPNRSLATLDPRGVEADFGIPLPAALESANFRVPANSQGGTRVETARFARENRMSATIDSHGSEAEIAQLAHAIWESEGRPEGRHLEHWQRARQMIERGEDASHLPRPVQPGFEDAAPGMVPEMKQATEEDELREGPGGRFAKQLAEAPEEPNSQAASSDEDAEAPDEPGPVVAGPDARSRAQDG